MESDPVIEFLKTVTWVKVLKWTLVPFVVTLQIIAVIWLIQLMNDDSPPPETTITTTVTTPTETTTP